MNNLWFKSDLFEVEPREDDEINPRMYGRQLAHWLKTRLEQIGYDVEPVIAEDWGRCLMVSRNPFMLWIGCGSIVEDGDVNEHNPPPAKENIVWHCFVEAEISIFKRLFNKPDVVPARNKLTADLARILASEAQITMVDEPS